MASYKTCPHPEEDHLKLSGSVLRKKLASGESIPEEFSRPEVLQILTDYYQARNPKLI
jgi:sulfate adenylyltransferase